MLNNKKIVKFITAIAIIWAIFCINNKAVYAGTSVPGIFSSAKSFIEQGKAGATVDTGVIAKDLGGLGQILLVIGLGVAVGVGMYLGFKYMMSGADEKAKVKERLIYYVIAIVLLVSAVGITKMIVSIGDSI